MRKRGERAMLKALSAALLQPKSKKIQNLRILSSTQKNPTPTIFAEAF